jgi:prevent-host-death family protein
MQNARPTAHEPAARTVGIRELSEHAEEIVREVQTTGRPVDITADGETVAHLTPSSRTDRGGTSDVEERRRAVSDWLARMDDVSRQIGTAWPRGVSAQDVIDNIRVPW